MKGFVEGHKVDLFSADGFAGQFIGFYCRIGQIVELLPVEVIFNSETVSERFVFEPFSLRFSELMICGVIEGYVVELAILHH